ncbi:MAG: TetR/AcrR family transcriptional regulator, partial [Acidobacteriota bacterium]
MTTKEKIIDAAVTEFSKGGYPGARVENIAVNAGVNKAMIFYYFGSKEELYKVIIKKIIGELFLTLMNNGAFKLTPEPETFFDTFTENYIRFFSKNRKY